MHTRMHTHTHECMHTQTQTQTQTQTHTLQTLYSANAVGKFVNTVIHGVENDTHFAKLNFPLLLYHGI